MKRKELLSWTDIENLEKELINAEGDRELIIIIRQQIIAKEYARTELVKRSEKLGNFHPKLIIHNIILILLSLGFVNPMQMMVW